MFSCTTENDWLHISLLTNINIINTVIHNLKLDAVFPGLTESISIQIRTTMCFYRFDTNIEMAKYNRISPFTLQFEVKAINNKVIKQHYIGQSIICADGRNEKKNKVREGIFGGQRGLHFPKSSIILLLFCACWASCSALDISIISRSRWKVRSRDIGGSSDLLPLSIESSPRSPKPLMSALMFPTFPCKRRRVSWSCKALL